MKIFIQKSINSIFINIFSIRYFVKKNFLSRKISKKAPSKRAISSKIEFSRSSFQVSKEASILETSNSSWGGKKSERIGKKFRTLWEFNWRVFLRQFLRLETVIALVNLQNNHVETSPPREAWQHVTRRAARVGCSRGGVARSTCLWRAPTSCPTLVQPRAVKGHRKGGMRRR